MRNSLIEQIQSEPIRAAAGEPWPVEVLLFTQLPVAETLEMQNAFAARLAHASQGEVGHHQLIMLEHPPTLVHAALDDTQGETDFVIARIPWLEADREWLAPVRLAVHVTMDLRAAGLDLDLLRAALHRAVDAAFSDLEIEFVPGVAAVHVVADPASPSVARALLAIDTNADSDFPLLLGLPPTISMAELGLDIARQDEVREVFLRHLESALGARFILPQRENAAKPPWLKAKAPFGPGTAHVREIIESKHLHTVCESARCPNLGECWKHGTATFMINGNVCTRSCSFCAVLTGRPQTIDLDEPRRVAEAAAQMNLKYVVVTAVNRDELPDGGASQFVATIAALRTAISGVRVEVLIPDFRGVESALDSVFAARPEVLNHNIETVPRLYSRVRPQARYQRSLDALARARAAGLVTKSGIMLGLGEEESEIDQTLQDLAAHGVQIVTIGQYLRPSAQHHPLVRYVTPAEFDHWRERGLALGFTAVESGPLVRSSYHAHQSYGRHADGNG